MKKLLIALCFMAITSIACGGSGGGSAGSENPNTSTSSCEFNMSSFTNGSDENSATSHWTCSDQYNSYNMAAYSDGTGVSTDIGSFTWTETGCGEISISYSGGTGTVTDIDGSIAAGTGTFTQKTTLYATCDLVEYETNYFSAYTLNELTSDCLDQEDIELPGMIKLYYTSSYYSGGTLYTTPSSTVQIYDMNGTLLITAEILSDGTIDFEWDGYFCNGDRSTYGNSLDGDCINANNDTCDFNYDES